MFSSYNRRNAAYAAVGAGLSQYLRERRSGKYDPIGAATRWSRDQMKKKIRDQTSKKDKPFKKIITGLPNKANSISGPGKSAGFVGRKKYSKKYLKYDKKKGLKGCTLQQEVGFQVVGTEVVFAGHCTHSENQVSFTVSMAIIKHLFEKHCVDIVGGNLSTLLLSSNSYTLGDQFQIFVRDRETGVNNIVTFHTVAAGDTVQTLITSLQTQINTIYSSTSTSLVGINFIPAPASSVAQGKDRLTINLSGASFVIDSKSTLKMQNRTVLVATDNTSDDVNNQPINGRFYESSGTFLQARKVETAQSVVGSRLYGEVRFGVDRGGNIDYREPPPATFFSNVKRCGKAKLNPGELKTSVLSKKDYVSILKLHKYFNTTSVTASATDGGLVRVFGFEKMLDCESTAGNITLACEIDTKITCMMYVKNAFYWAPSNASKVILS